MKEVFKTQQKSHMRQVKEDNKRVTASGRGKGQSAPAKKEFVQDCLVRVELQEKWEESERDKLKVL